MEEIYHENGRKMEKQNFDLNVNNEVSNQVEMHEDEL